MHSSNVFGVVFPISKIGAMCKKKGIRFIVDAAQGAGVADINAKRDNIDILCAPGHKSLFGAMGTGFMALSENVTLNTIMQGGTGSLSLSLNQPDFLPDRFEAGTLNNSGIVSMGDGIDYINSVGREKIYAHEISLVEQLYDSLVAIDSVKLYTAKPEMNKSMPIISFNLKDYSSEHVASELAKKDICVRGGYHCSPFAHHHFGTIDTGTVRISPGCFNTENDCSKFINIVKKL
jgi:selenocysteine lyase/cysteine desulfurase